MKVWGAFPVADGPSAVETACGLIAVKKRGPSDRQLLCDGRVSWRVRNYVRERRLH